MHQLGELEDRSLSDIVHYNGCLVCVLKKVDIFIDWTSWSVNGPIILSNLWLEYGLSSNQTRTNDIRNVVLLVVDPSSIHHYIFWVWPMLSLVHIIMEFHLHGNLDELLLSPSAILLPSPWLVLNIQLVLETFESIFFVLVHEAYVWMKGVTSFNSCAFDASCRRELEKACFYLLWNRPKSVMHVRMYSMVW